ncbi:MAG: superoxide dismutase [Deltaproteobacteria bacterium]
MNENLYVLPQLPYDYKALEPYISEETLRIHHDKLHQKYVSNANEDLVKLNSARTDKAMPDMKSLLKDLSFNIGGHVLHSLLWESMCKKGDSAAMPQGNLGEAIEKEFGDLTRFQQEFAKAAFSVEGSGWAALAFCRLTQRPMIMQIEKHNVDIFPTFQIILVLDSWEHAYYLDYRQERAKYIDAFWNICNWDKVGERFDSLMGVPAEARR